jgi:glycolate oxidase FAD binding subunit
MSAPAEPVPPQLAAACPAVRVADQADQVEDTPARFVAEPASTAEAAALLKAAAGLQLTVVPRGAGTRLNWGLPPRSGDLIVDTRRLSAIIEHAAGDLVVRVEAGVRLDDLQDKLAAEGQRLALDPQERGTIGGLVATNAAGPLRFRYGAPRDLLIGITVVRADGTVARAGGKVVKNVAGYDLGKLFAGSYGTLGLITEATFRLHPLPPVSAAVTVECTDPADASGVIHEVASSPLVPSAIDLDWHPGSGPMTVSVLLEGDDASVSERAGRLVGLLGNRATAGSRSAQRKRADLDRSHPAGSEGGTQIRVAFWVGQLEPVLTAIRTAAAAHGLDAAVSGSAAAGVLDVGISDHASAEGISAFVADLRDRLAELRGQDMPPSIASAVVVTAPAEVREVVDLWGPVPSAGLMRAIKDQFDPEGRMTPGRFAGGI